MTVLASDIIDTVSAVAILMYAFVLSVTLPRDMVGKERNRYALTLLCLPFAFATTLIVISYSDLITGRYGDTQSWLSFVAHSAPFILLALGYIYALKRIQRDLLRQRNLPR